MAKGKDKKLVGKKVVVPKFQIPEGSHAINPFYFELTELSKLIEECQERKLHSLAIALRKIHHEINKKRDSYRWIEPE